MVAALDLIGKTFGRLKVAARTQSDVHGKARWSCVCECGQSTITQSGQLTSGKTRSCGCLQREAAAASTSARSTHRLTGTPEHIAWVNMRNRCTNKNHDAFKNYGGRGIAVCDRWQSFEAFLEDVGKRPSPSHSLDRYPDNDGNYEPGNVRWATVLEQRHNQRRTAKAAA